LAASPLTKCKIFLVRENVPEGKKKSNINRIPGMWKIESTRERGGSIHEKIKISAGGEVMVKKASKGQEFEEGG